MAQSTEKPKDQSLLIEELHGRSIHSRMLHLLPCARTHGASFTGKIAPRLGGSTSDTVCRIEQFMGACRGYALGCVV